MRRGTLVLLIFFLVAVGIVAASQLLWSRPPLELRIAVSPLAADWVSAAAERFNAQPNAVSGSRRVAVVVQPIEDLVVWNNQVNWTDSNIEEGLRPSLWLPASSAVQPYIASDRRLPFITAANSTAQTVLVWGGYTERVAVLLADGSAFDWERIGQVASAGDWGASGGQANWGYLDLAFGNPQNTTSGATVLLSAASNYYQSGALTPEMLRDAEFRAWLLPIMRSVPNFNTLGANPAQAIAQRGNSIADMALLPESQWLPHLSSIGSPETFMLAYPTHPAMLDFPLLRWESALVTEEERTAMGRFETWLMAEAQQALTVRYGLRPASGVLPADAPLFTEGAAYGVLETLPPQPVLRAPTKADMLSLLTWYNQNR